MLTHTVNSSNSHELFLNTFVQVFFHLFYDLVHLSEVLGNHAINVLVVAAEQAPHQPVRDGPVGLVDEHLNKAKEI